MKWLFLCLAICWCGTAIATTCDVGHYLENGECKYCNPDLEPFYCPGDDTRHACPTTDTDYEKLSGWTMLDGTAGKGGEAWWAPRGATSVRMCTGNLYFQDLHGNEVIVECTFNGENYWCDRREWYVAAPGFYLANYSSTTWEIWYSSVKPCTNAPANAHYTGSGTPDAPDGSVVDANDCPWVCDAGFGKSASGQCLPLCGAGITKIRAGSVSVPLFNEKHTSPALAIEYADQVCYADLVLEAGRPAINIDYNGQIYHTVNK